MAGVLKVPRGLPGGVSSVGIVLRSGSALDCLAWPDKDLRDDVPRWIDLTALLADYGTTISGTPTVEATPPLTASMLYVAGAVVWMLVSGGDLATPAAVALTVPLADGGDVDIVIAQPVIDRRAGYAFAPPVVPVVPPGAVAMGGRLLSMAGRIITMGNGVPAVTPLGTTLAMGGRSLAMGGSILTMGA